MQRDQVPFHHGRADRSGLAIEFDPGFAFVRPLHGLVELKGDFLAAAAGEASALEVGRGKHVGFGQAVVVLLHDGNDQLGDLFVTFLVKMAQSPTAGAAEDAPAEARDGWQAVLMVARLSGCQADSSCLAMVNQVRIITLIRDVLMLESNAVENTLEALL